MKVVQIAAGRPRVKESDNCGNELIAECKATSEATALSEI
jgi:hypothetical protein